MSTERPLVGVIMGSTSDWEVMRHASETLERLGVPHEARVVSAHRTPDLLFEYAETRRGARPAGADRRRRRRRPPARHGRREDAAAGARRADALAPPERPRLAGVDRADARRHPGRHARDRPGGRDQRGAARDGDPGALARPSCARCSSGSAASRPTRCSHGPTRARLDRTARRSSAASAAASSAACWRSPPRRSASSFAAWIPPRTPARATSAS